MANEETFRQRRPQEDDGEELGALEMMKKMKQMQQDVNPTLGPKPDNPPFEMKGNPPEQFKKMLAAKAENPEKIQQELSGNIPKRGFTKKLNPNEENFEEQYVPPNKSVNDLRAAFSGAPTSGHLKELLDNLKGLSSVYEEIELPSLGKFYNDSNGPSSGIVSIRPMTGEDEQILATPRFVRKGQAINMIFQRCIKERFNPENLLTIDRNYLLIYLRGVSYGTNYDVEIKCPGCERKFSTTIDLDTLYVETCPDGFGPKLQEVLPTSKLPFAYRLSTGKDEQEIVDHRERRIKAFGDNSTDDSLIYRTAMLLEHIDGLTNKAELQVIVKNLPISDVSYIRNCINEPPFGVDTNVEMVCPSCLHDFEVDLPLEANFFFPRRKKNKT